MALFISLFSMGLNRSVSIPIFIGIIFTRIRSWFFDCRASWSYRGVVHSAYAGGRTIIGAGIGAGRGNGGRDLWKYRRVWLDVHRWLFDRSKTVARFARRRVSVLPWSPNFFLPARAKRFARARTWTRRRVQLDFFSDAHESHDDSIVRDDVRRHCARQC